MKLLMPLILAAMSAYPSVLSTVTYDQSQPSLFEYVEVNLNGEVLMTDAGQIGILIDGTSPVLMYCADVFTLLQYGPTPVDQILSQNFPNGGRLAWLYNNYNPTLTQSWEAVALQLAIWEIISDNNTDNLNDGSFQTTANTSAQISTLTTAMLQASSGRTSTGLTFWQASDGPSTSQTLLSATPQAPVLAPEPAYGVMVGVSLVIIGLARRRQ